MAGIYIHIPFCESRCYYCDFYSSTYKGNKEEYLRMVCKELSERREYLHGETVKTLYLGGGTPSLLDCSDLALLIDTVRNCFDCDLEEVTMEANPEDLTSDYLKSIASLPINRLSIGVQSFDDAELKLINRRHSAERANQCIKDAQNVGFENISIDLIYGLPNQTLEKWQTNVHKALSCQVQHISAYSLTFEEHSMLTKMKEKGLVCEQDEEVSLAMFKLLRRELSNQGILPYEISNFARPGYESKHNSSYWNYVPYLGVGPSAHSFDGCSRQWNVANTREYLRKMACGEVCHEREELDVYARYNEYVMTGLRRTVGVSIRDLNRLFGDLLSEYFVENISSFWKEGKVVQTNDRFSLSEEGIFISDYIIEQLLWVE